jgi:Cobalamin biosynthesis protein CbiK, Co2+ chelatase
LYKDLKDPVILMGHGSEHKNDISYDKLQDELDKIGSKKYYIATVEGKTTIEDIVIKLKNQGEKSVYLIPFMLVCGDHANNDMAGDEDDSWKNLLKSENIVAHPILKGLGEYEEVAKFFIKKINSII